GDQPLGIGILLARDGGVDRGGNGAHLGVDAGMVGLGAFELGAGYDDLRHIGRQRMGVIQRLLGSRKVALGHAAPRGRYQLERARILGAQLIGLPVVAAPRAGGAVLEIGPAGIGAVAPAAVLDGAVGVIELLAQERLVDRRQDETQIVLQ